MGEKRGIDFSAEYTPDKNRTEIVRQKIYNQLCRKQRIIEHSEESNGLTLLTTTTPSQMAANAQHSDSNGHMNRTKIVREMICNLMCRKQRSIVDCEEGNLTENLIGNDDNDANCIEMSDIQRGDATE